MKHYIIRTLCILRVMYCCIVLCNSVLVLYMQSLFPPCQYFICSKLLINPPYPDLRSTPTRISAGWPQHVTRCRVCVGAGWRQGPSLRRRRWRPCASWRSSRSRSTSSTTPLSPSQCSTTPPPPSCSRRSARRPTSSSARGASELRRHTEERLDDGGAILPAPAVPVSTRISARLKRANTIQP